MTPKEKKRVLLVVNVLLFVLLFGLISFNKEVIRPEYSDIPLVHLLSGSFPNFIAAFIISLAFTNGVIAKRVEHTRFFVYLSALLVFIILTVEEFSPMWGASTWYDSADILASGIGSLCTILIFESLTLNKRKRKHKSL